MDVLGGVGSVHMQHVVRTLTVGSILIYLSHR